MRKRLLLPIILLAGLAATLGVIYYERIPADDGGPVSVHHTNLPHTSVTDDRAAGSSTASTSTFSTPVAVPFTWSLYSNRDYGFEFKYPNDPALLKYTAVGFIPGTCNIGAALICFSYSPNKIPNTNFDGMGFLVTIAHNSDDSVITTAKDCYSNIGMDTGETKTINGVTYHITNNSGGAGGHIENADNYLVFKNNKCFDIRIQENTLSDSDLYPRAMTDQEQQQISSVFDQMLATFKFTN